MHTHDECMQYAMLAATSDSSCGREIEVRQHHELEKGTSKCSWDFLASTGMGRPSGPGGAFRAGFWYRLGSNRVGLIVGLLCRREHLSPCLQALRSNANRSASSSQTIESDHSQILWDSHAPTVEHSLRREENSACSQKLVSVVRCRSSEGLHAELLLVIQRLLHMTVPGSTGSVSASYSKGLPDFEVERTVDSVLLCSEDGGKMLSHTGCPSSLALAAPAFDHQISMLRCRGLATRILSRATRI